MTRYGGTVREFNNDGGWGLLDLASTRPHTMSDKEFEQGIYFTKDAINSADKTMTFLPKYKPEVGEQVSFKMKKGKDGWWLADDMADVSGQPLQNEMQKKVMQYYYTGSVPKDGPPARSKGKGKGEEEKEKEPPPVVVPQQAQVQSQVTSTYEQLVQAAAYQGYQQQQQYQQGYQQQYQQAWGQPLQQMYAAMGQMGVDTSQYGYNNPMMQMQQQQQQHYQQQQEQQQEQHYQKPVPVKPESIDLIPEFQALEQKRPEIDEERKKSRQTQRLHCKIPAWEQPGRRIKKVLPKPGESIEEYEAGRQERIAESHRLAENSEAWAQAVAKYPELVDEQGALVHPLEIATRKRKIEDVYQGEKSGIDMSQNYLNRDGQRVPIEEFIRAESLNSDAQKLLVSLDDGIRRAVIKKWTPQDSGMDQSGRFIAFCKSFNREGMAPPGQGKWHGLRGKEIQKGGQEEEEG